MKNINFSEKSRYNPVIPGIMLILLLFAGCEFERDNPVDPYTTLGPDEWAPTDLTSEIVNSTQVRLVWTFRHYGLNIDIDGFIITRREGTAAAVELSRVGAYDRLYTDVTVDVNTEYTYGVSAYFGEAVSSEETVDLSISYSIAAPSDLILEKLDDTSLELTWTDNSDNEDGFIIERKEGTGTYTEITTTSANTTSYIDSGLDSFITYTYRVKAVSDWGSSDFSPEARLNLSFEIQPPDGLTGTVADEHAVLLTWNDNSDNEDGFEIIRSVNGGEFQSVLITEHDDTSFTDGDLETGSICTYRVRAVNILNGESDWSEEIQLTAGHITDIDGNSYRIVTIGDQIWMAENLKVTHLRNGDAVDYTFYDGIILNLDTYGALYEYPTAAGGQLAPEGWHVPSEGEWEELAAYLGEDAGTKLKSTYDWANDGNGSDESGFSALPGGYLDYDYWDGITTYTYYDLTYTAYFWTTDDGPKETRTAYYRSLTAGADLSSGQCSWFCYLSVRCVKD